MRIRFCFTYLVLFFCAGTCLADVRISDLDDLQFGMWGGGGAVSRSDLVCVYNSKNPKYLISARGSGSGGSFQLSAGADTISYSVQWRKQGGSFKSLTPAVSQTFMGADKKKEDCGGATNAEVQVSFSIAQLQQAGPASYSGLLTITIEPA